MTLKIFLGRKEGNVLFNDALNTFYLRLHGVGHMVKDHSDSEKGNLLPPHRLLFPINSKGSFISTIPDRIAHTTTFVTPVVEHWLEREIVQWVHPMKDRSDDPLHHEQTLLSQGYISLPFSWEDHRSFLMFLGCIFLEEMTCYFNDLDLIGFRHVSLVNSWFFVWCKTENVSTLHIILKINLFQS